MRPPRSAASAVGPPSGRRLRRLGVCLALGAGVLAGPTAGEAVAQEPVADAVPGTRVVVVGVPGLRWDDVDRLSTPALTRLAETSALGVLSVKARPATSCPADGWLTLGAGARAEAFGLPCRTPERGEGDQAALAERNRATRDAADVRALADALRSDGLCLAARGAGGELAGGDAARVCPALLVDAPAVTGDGGGRASSAAAADAVVGEVDAARSPGSVLLVVGVSGVPEDDEAHLHLALASGPGFGGGALRSASTRRAPYVQLVDVAPTVLDLLGVPPPPPMVGQPWRTVAGTPTRDGLLDLDRRAVEARGAQVAFFVVLVGGLLAGLGAAFRARSWPVGEVVGLSALAAVGGSYLVMLVPWWRAPSPVVALVVLTAAVAALAAASARRLPGRTAPVTAVTAGVALLLAVDLLTGARLQVDAPAGYSPLVAGRFAGIGNVAFGVFAACTLLGLAGATARRSPRGALAAVVVVGVLAVVVDGAPPFGSDVGGVLALVPALVLLGLLRSRTPVTVARLAAGGVAGAVVVTAFAVADAARPAADRTHLGRFVDAVRDGTAGVVLRRKAEAIADLLLANPATALLPVVVAAAVVLVARPPAPLRAVFEDVPAWRQGLLAVGLMSLVGFAVNDSGPAVPALALLVAAPASVAVAARVAACRGQGVPADR